MDDVKFVEGFSYLRKVLTCGHHFHAHCIVQWFKAPADAGRRSCPNCRKKQAITPSLAAEHQQISAPAPLLRAKDESVKSVSAAALQPVHRANAPRALS